MNVTSDQFRKDNTVLFRAKIVHQSNESIYANRQDGADYIDLNNNWKADYKDLKPSTILRCRQVIQRTEPALTVPLRVISEAARNGKHGEVITADRLANVQIEDVLLRDSTGSVWHKAECTKARSLATLVPQYAPLDPDASYAIDVRMGEFLIYRPGQ